MAKEREVDIARLCAAMQRSRQTLSYPRQQRFDMVRQYVGAHWSEEGSQKPVPCNLLAAYISIVGRKLIAQNPRVLLSTWDRAMRPTVKAMNQWVNKEIVKMDLAMTLQRNVLDALFSVGCCKVALATPADSALHGWQHKAGKPFAQRVDLDDLVFDVHARDFSEVGYIGHRFRAPLAAIKESKIYSRERRQLAATDDRIYNLEGDERIGFLGRTTLAGEDEEYEDFVDLWEVYLPRHQLVLTLVDDQLLGAGALADKAKGKALRIQNWLGPEKGPYHILGMGTVPGNPMPKAPMQDLYDLHIAINAMLRKLVRQAERQKEVLPVRTGQSEDGSRIIETNDGEAFRSDGEPPVPVNFGGPNQANFQTMEAFRNLFSWLAGNLDIMGGLSPQSRTAHQDEMLNQNSSATLAEMQARVTVHTADIVKALCWYWHHDPLNVTTAEYSVPGMPQISTALRTWPNNPAVHQNVPGRMVRSHDFDDMDIAVDPFSLQYQTPQSRLAALNQLVSQVIAPMMPLLQQQGVAFDINAYLEKWARYNDSPDVTEIVTIREPPQESSSSPDENQSVRPGQTTRNYVRRSLGQDSAQAKAAQTQNQPSWEPSKNGAGAA